MPYNRKAFGIIIGRLRAVKNLSQESLSAMAEISRSHLAMIENGRKTMRLDTLWRLSEALEISPSKIITLMEEDVNSKALVSSDP